MRIPNRFSVKSLLIFTAIVAMVLAAIELRPPPQIRVAFQTIDSAMIDGELIETEALRSTIEQERTWRKLWFQKSDIIIELPESILVDEEHLLDNKATVTIQELINPTPRKQIIRAWDVADLLKKHNLSDLDDFVIGGVNRGNGKLKNAR